MQSVVADNDENNDDDGGDYYDDDDASDIEDDNWEINLKKILKYFCRNVKISEDTLQGYTFGFVFRFV